MNIRHATVIATLVAATSALGMVAIAHASPFSSGTSTPSSLSAADVATHTAQINMQRSKLAAARTAELPPLPKMPKLPPISVPAVGGGGGGAPVYYASSGGGASTGSSTGSHGARTHGSATAASTAAPQHIVYVTEPAPTTTSGEHESEHESEPAEPQEPSDD